MANHVAGSLPLSYLPPSHVYYEKGGHISSPHVRRLHLVDALRVPVLSACGGGTGVSVPRPSEAATSMGGGFLEIAFSGTVVGLCHDRLMMKGSAAALLVFTAALGSACEAFFSRFLVRPWCEVPSQLS